MKKVLTILAFTLLPLLSMGQETNVDIKNNDTVETVIENKVETPKIKKETTSSSAAKAQLLKINRKKTSEIISIKAYRKSLQIKVKTIKLC
ncbi:hypothetical protein [Psychroserpens algicola]|uniref:Uncharacterized protein n=1 Tax=Psychroserpens algicola TaxID=1719034 RepID=A0ABT0H9J6_9FLAO|nr:hypothetical protein [Psychroserpens algicola]MCK8481056.1 hypothetical protein [Psychroserpens algicola]